MQIFGIIPAGRAGEKGDAARKKPHGLVIAPSTNNNSNSDAAAAEQQDPRDLAAMRARPGDRSRTTATETTGRLSRNSRIGLVLGGDSGGGEQRRPPEAPRLLFHNRAHAPQQREHSPEQVGHIQIADLAVISKPEIQGAGDRRSSLPDFLIGRSGFRLTPRPPPARAISPTHQMMPSDIIDSPAGPAPQKGHVAGWVMPRSRHAGRATAHAPSAQTCDRQRRNRQQQVRAAADR